MHIAALEHGAPVGVDDLALLRDHIVVFDGNPRLAGQTMAIDIDDATSFTLYGNVVTGEQIGVGGECCEMPTVDRERIALPLIG